MARRWPQDFSRGHNDVIAVIADIQKEYGNTDTVTFTRGKVHNCLGMKIYFSAPDKVEITINNYIFDIINDAPDGMLGEAVITTGAHLFQVNKEDPIYLDDKAAVEFHHIVARLFFLCKRVRPYLQTAAAFLCTRVNKPDTYDWNTMWV